MSRNAALALPLLSFLLGCPDDADTETGTPTEDTDVETDADTDADADADTDTDTDTILDTDTTPALFDLTLAGTGYGVHADQKMEAAVLQGQAVLASTEITVPQNGNIMIVFEQILVPGQSYQLVWYADLSGDGECQPDPYDHGWLRPVPNVPATDVVVQANHNVDFLMDVCDAF